MVVRCRLLRLFRLLVAITAFFVAHPSTAAGAVVDRIVLVAGAEAGEAPSESDDREDDSSRPRSIAASARARAADVPSLTPLLSTRALRERAYLLHCALLR